MTTDREDIELAAHYMADAVVRRFESLVGGPLLTSSLVHKATKDILMVMFSEDTGVSMVRSLHEFEQLEAALKARHALQENDRG